MKLLIKAKAAINQAMNDGCTPLFIASQQGHVEAVKLLIKAKAAINKAKSNRRRRDRDAKNKAANVAATAGRKTATVGGGGKSASFVRHGAVFDDVSHHVLCMVFSVVICIKK